MPNYITNILKANHLVLSAIKSPFRLSISAISFANGIPGAQVRIAREMVL